MTHASNNTMTIAEFERLLDVYGSDRTRWPVDARASAGQLVARDKAARRLLAEAEALDRALERAPLPSLAERGGAGRPHPRGRAALAAHGARQAMRRPRRGDCPCDRQRGPAARPARAAALAGRDRRLAALPACWPLPSRSAYLPRPFQLAAEVLPALEELTGIGSAPRQLRRGADRSRWMRTCYERRRQRAGAANDARAPRWMLVALFASLALNLHRPRLGRRRHVALPQRRRRGPRVTPNLLGYASTLPAERRKELWERTARRSGSNIRPFRREVRAAREETIKALVAEPFDRQQFMAAQARQAEAETARARPCRTSIVKIADDLTPEERRAFPRWREHRRPPGHNLLDEPDQQAGEPRSQR